jgi:hypothetical protein
LSGIFNGFDKINVALLYSPTHYILIYFKVFQNLNIWNTRWQDDNIKMEHRKHVVGMRNWFHCIRIVPVIDFDSRSAEALDFSARETVINKGWKRKKYMNKFWKCLLLFTWEIEIILKKQWTSSGKETEDIKTSIWFIKIT